MSSQDPFGLQYHRRNENHGVGKWLCPGPQPTVGCLVSGNPVSASWETQVVSASLRTPYKGGVQSLFVGGVGRQMDNGMKGRRKRGLRGVLSRMKGRQKKKFKKARECPFSLLVYFTSFVPDAHSTHPVYWDHKCGTVTGGWSICGSSWEEWKRTQMVCGGKERPGVARRSSTGLPSRHLESKRVLSSRSFLASSRSVCTMYWVSKTCF